jgi:hypothetical protein
MPRAFLLTRTISPQPDKPNVTALLQQEQPDPQPGLAPYERLLYADTCTLITAAGTPVFLTAYTLKSFDTTIDNKGQAWRVNQIFEELSRKAEDLSAIAFDNARVTFSPEDDEERTIVMEYGSGSELRYIWWQIAGVHVHTDHMSARR